MDQDCFCCCISVSVTESAMVVGLYSLHWRCNRCCERNTFLSLNQTLQLYPCSCRFPFFIVGSGFGNTKDLWWVVNFGKLFMVNKYVTSEMFRWKWKFPSQSEMAFSFTDNLLECYHNLKSINKLTVRAWKSSNTCEDVFGCFPWSVLFHSVSWPQTYLMKSDINIRGFVPAAQTALGTCAVLWVTCAVLGGALVSFQCSTYLQTSSCSWKFFSLWPARQSVVALKRQDFMLPHFSALKTEHQSSAQSNFLQNPCGELLQGSLMADTVSFIGFF